jgi:metallo-beta-lactamase family protein
MKTGMRVTFLGAAGTVTGSKYLVEAGDTRLLVDCGLYQGVKALRLRNRKPVPLDIGALDAVVLSHAHIDHSGYTPALVRDGFRGPVHASEGTADLCRVLLPDAGRIQEEDARYANKKGFSKHHPALPLYDESDAERALELFEPVALGTWRAVGDLQFRLRPAGHILGAASVEIEHDGRTVLFSGDLGRDDDLLMHAPEAPGAPDWLVVESTYGDRLHEPAEPFVALAQILERTVGRGGVLLIPSFAVGRAQTMLYCFHEIFRRNLADRLPVFVDSPMATDVTEIFRRSPELHRLPNDQCSEVCDVAQYTRTPDASRELTARSSPSVIISASGMASGGRVLHHLKSLLPDKRHTVLFPGFQAPGTRGQALVGGTKSVKIHGSYVPVEAEVLQLDVFSAHADQRGLLDWIGRCERPPRHVFVTHGEPAPADTLRRLIVDEVGVKAHAPEYKEVAELVVGEGNR